MAVTWGGWSAERIPGYRAAVTNPVGAYVDAVLRGVGQVMFQNNPVTGLLFLAGIFYNSVTFGAYAVLGTAVSTLVAILLGVGRDVWRAGLFGFNGTLAGIAFAFFLEPGLNLVGYTVAGAACTSVIMAALLNMLGTWKVPALTAPFVLTTWLFLFAFFSFGVLRPTEFLAPGAFPAQVAAPGTVVPDAVAEGFFKGVGEVMFQDNAVTGALFLAGILVNSRISLAFAAGGSLLAFLAAWALGAAEAPLRLGLFGFNAVLTAIALGGLFVLLGTWSALYALFGVLVTTVVFAALANALAPWGMPALTAPFVLTTWLFLAGAPLLARLRPVAPAEATTAEGNLRAFRARGVAPGTP